jgi:hypothetical protein
MNIGNFVGPLLSERADTPAYGPIPVTVIRASIAAAILAGIYRYVRSWKKVHRNNAGITMEIDNAFDDDLTNMENPQLRDTLCSIKWDWTLSQAFLHSLVRPSRVVE